MVLGLVKPERTAEYGRRRIPAKTNNRTLVFSLQGNEFQALERYGKRSERASFSLKFSWSLDMKIAC